MRQITDQNKTIALKLLSNRTNNTVLREVLFARLLNWRFTFFVSFFLAIESTFDATECVVLFRV